MIFNHKYNKQYFTIYTIYNLQRCVKNIIYNEIDIVIQLHVRLNNLTSKKREGNF